MPGERTEKYYHKVESGFDSNQENYYESKEEFDIDSSIVRRGQIKKSKSGIVNADHEKRDSQSGAPKKSYSSEDYDEDLKAANGNSNTYDRSLAGKSTQ